MTIPAFGAPHTLIAAAAGLALIAASLSGVALAQGDLGDTVTWSIASAPPVKPGGHVQLQVRGVVQDGWHVYALKQREDGPTPLRVDLAASAVASADGALKASAPIKRHDPSFGFETQYYAQPFTVTVPVRIAAKLSPGIKAIPVSVRFQTCNGHICQPPTTVRLSAPITVE